MQTATGTLTAEIQGKDRKNVGVVKWDPLRNGTYVCFPGVFSDVFNDVYSGVGDIGTLTSWTESVGVSRSLSTDLPEASKSDAGFASADATVVLAGNTFVGNVALEKVFGGFGNPLSTLTPRIGTPITVDLGFRGSAGVEVLRQFTGKVRGCSVDPQSGSVTLTCLDRREAFRTPVSLPVVVRDDFGTVRPGLNAAWLLDWIARRQGFCVSPQIRSQAVLSATMHGSAWPEVGSQLTATLFNATPAKIGPVTFDYGMTSGIPGLAALRADATYTLAGVDYNAGSNAFIQAWFQGSADSAQLLLLNDNGVTGITLSVKANPVAHTVAVSLQRGGLTPVTTTVATAALTSGVEHYLAVHVAFTTAGATLNVRVDGTTYTGSIVIAASTGNAMATRAVASAATTVVFSIRDLQITTEAFSASMWDNAFVPTAVFEPSLNELTATPTVDTSDPWEICQQIASAEQGIFGFDENGVLRFYNRNHMTGGAAVATITTDPSVAFANLIQAASDEQVDGVANYITVSAQPLAVDPPSTAIWTLAELVGIPAFGRITLQMELPGPAISLAGATWSASTSADGTGGDVSTNIGFVFGPATSATTRTLYVSNSNSFDIFLVGNLTVGTTGDPNVTVLGQCLRSTLDSGYTAIAQDMSSQTLYGYQSLDVPANPWMQSTESADALAAALVAALKDPHATLTGVEIVADYRLQLADRVRVKDPTGLYLDGDFWLIASSPQFSASDTGQSVTLRQV